ncbi:MAG: Cobalamin B12-binding domain protein [candidate division TA06 bacterium 34_109]|uniref:Cobalamin B12-binding domain protein n=1 Tax=candidate division TA06 bacterium 34_109 TaxID=1635277 RepID=A0A101I0K3_UNCT6|nr:MAG: Cobalamin B12-binding domain protein [candidate division TA06 bacterium 34_109]
MTEIRDKKKVLLIPLDPVHDVALKIINRKLKDRGHQTILLPPDLPLEEIISRASEINVDYILVSRTLGYGVAELLSKFIDMLDAAKIRDKARIVLGGKAITPQLAAELGFDRGFGSGADFEEIIAYLEEREYQQEKEKLFRKKVSIPARYTYQYKNDKIKKLLNEITDEIIQWSNNKTSPAIERAKLREKMIGINKDTGLTQQDKSNKIKLLQENYLTYCDEKILQFYQNGKLPNKVRALSSEEISKLDVYIQKEKENINFKKLRHSQSLPLVFVQYGTGCPIMDIAHIKTSEAWGADGVFHFDPSWGARTEGFLEGVLSHEEDGSIITWENLAKIKSSLHQETLWTVRAHRGLNTPETAVLAGELGADLTKIHIVYGALNGGTDPARLTIDGIETIKYAAKYKMPFDEPTNEELGGVPAYKSFAGLLIIADLALKLKAQPILKPLFCYSPDVMITGKMDDNYIDYNVAKINSLRSIIDAPIWPGEPIGFMTHSEDRIQSSLTTALHAALAISQQVDAITIASADEAYSRGPISISSRIDTLRAVQEVFRFFGKAEIKPTAKAKEYEKEIKQGIETTLEKIARRGSFVNALYEGLLGSPQDGAYPGLAGRDTIMER